VELRRVELNADKSVICPGCLSWGDHREEHDSDAVLEEFSEGVILLQTVPQRTTTIVVDLELIAE
jgi:hypothetical protein